MSRDVDRTVDRSGGTTVDEDSAEDEGAGDGNGATRLADELLEHEFDAPGNGVYAEVISIDERDGAIVMTADLPGDERIVERFEKPLPWSDEFAFARIVEAAGYGSATLDHLVGERVPVERVHDEWRFVDPGRDESAMIRYWRPAAVAVGLLVVVVSLFTLPFGPIGTFLALAALATVVGGTVLLAPLYRDWRADRDGR